MSASVGLKSFCPGCFKLWGNTKTIATHLWEVHYQLAISCDLCKSFASMSVQGILEHHSGCKVKHAIEHVEQEGHKVKKVTQEEVQGEKNRRKLLKVCSNSTLMNPAGQKDA